MVQLVIAFIILIAAAVLAGQVSRVKPRSLDHGQASESDRQQAAKSIRGLSSAIALGGVAIAVAIAATACVYSLDVGEVAVVRNLGGSVSGSQSEAGFHAKAPWQSAVKYDTRNNLINFYGDTDYETTGGSEVGKQVSINDKSGAGANIDIQVNYSLRPDAAVSLYRDYGSQENFVSKYISNDLRSVTREIAGKYDTITMLTDRLPFKAAQIFNILSDLIVIGICAVTLYYGVSLVITQQTSPYAGIKISTSWGYLAVVVGCGLMIIRCIASICTSIKALAHGQPIEPAETPKEGGDQA